MNATTIQIDSIEVRQNVRMHYDKAAICELADNIAQIGLQQPITVYQDGKKHVVVCGHRRFLAIKKLFSDGDGRFDRVPAVIIPRPSDEERIIIQLSENMNRREMSAEEITEAVGMLISVGWTRSQIARRLGKTATLISQYAIAYDFMKKNQVVKTMVENGQVNIDEIYKAVSVTGDADDAIELIKERKTKLTVTEFKAKIKRIQMRARTWRVEKKDNYSSMTIVFKSKKDYRKICDSIDGYLEKVIGKKATRS